MADATDRRRLLGELEAALPLTITRPPLPTGPMGVILVDVVRGFTREGNLADPESMAPMVAEVSRICRALDLALADHVHFLELRDSHHASIPEPPYPPHCIRGSGEELIDPELDWLSAHPRLRVIDKDCINGFVGAMEAAPGGLWRNHLVDWVQEHELTTLLLLGDCTDICVSDLAVALLSARNHGMLTRRSPLEGEAYAAAICELAILVHVPGCATFDLDPDELPPGQEHLRHPASIAHHVGLWLMASRGAVLVNGFERL